MPDMAAAVVRELGRVECERVPAPAPEAGRVLVRTSLASICGSDLHIAYQGWSVTGLPLPPGRPGHEGVGEVVDGGGTGFEPGQAVLTVPNIHESATFAGYQLLRPGNLVALPDTRPLAHLLMAQQLGTVIFGCRRLPPLDGKTVVVIGQGSVGLFHDFILRRLGAERIIAVDPVPARVQAAIDMGVDEAVPASGPAATEAILDLTGGEGAAVVIDAVGSVETLNQSLAVAAESGRVAAFGLPTTAGMVPFDWASLFRKSLTMHAVHGAQDTPGLPDFRAAVDLISNGEIDMSPFVTHSFPIDDVDRAFELADSKADGALKVSLTFN